MKILHLGYSDSKGGAAIAMMRLHKSLIEKNIDSNILVAEKNSNDPKVIGPTKSSEVILNQLKLILVRQKRFIFKSNHSFSHSLNFFSSNIIDKINKINPDIINLHWVNNEFLSIAQIGKIKQPIVWTFVDMWPMCGGEHYTETTRYKNGYLKNNRELQSSGIDLNRLIWTKKKKHWKSKIEKVVCISDWLKKKAVESDLFKDTDISKINCNIDLNDWQPIEKNTAKKILNLPLDKKLFLFLSTNGINYTRKGFQFVDSSLKKLSSQRSDFELIIVGKKTVIGKKDYNYRFIDKILDGNPVELRLLYSACDVVLMPSTIEAFGQVALEASSCGVPTVGFKETGITDIVEHKVNGYLSNYLDQEDFDKGINWILNLSDKENKYIYENCLKIVNKKFSNNHIAEKYIELYR